MRLYLGEGYEPSSADRCPDRLAISRRAKASGRRFSFPAILSRRPRLDRARKTRSRGRMRSDDAGQPRPAPTRGRPRPEPRSLAGSEHFELCTARRRVLTAVEPRRSHQLPSRATRRLQDRVRRVQSGPGSASCYLRRHQETRAARSSHPETGRFALDRLGPRVSALSVRGTCGEHAAARDNGRFRARSGCRSTWAGRKTLRGRGPSPSTRTGAARPTARASRYTCPVHPEVRSEPGQCAKCGMTLVSKVAGPGAALGRTRGADACASGPAGDLRHHVSDTVCATSAGQPISGSALQVSDASDVPSHERFRSLTGTIYTVTLRIPPPRPGS